MGNRVWKRYLSRVSYLILLIPFFLVLSTAFIVDPDLAGGVVSGKYFWFYVSMGLTSVSVFFLICFYPVRFRFGFLDAMVLLYGIAGLSWSYFYHQSGADTKHILFTLLLLLYFYFRIALPVNRTGRYGLTVFLIITVLVEAIWGLRQLYGFEESQHPLFRMTGSFFNPGPYSGYLAVITPLAFYYLLADYRVLKNRFSLRLSGFYLRWVISLLTVVTVLLVLPAAMSRTSWIAVLGGCSIAALMFFSEKYKLGDYIRKNRKKLILLAGVLLICIMAGLSGMYYLKKDSANGRSLMWKMSFQTLLHHPLGTGIGRFAGVYGNEQAVYFATGKGTGTEEHVAGGPEYAFNEYLQIGIEQGLVSLFLFLTIVVSALYRGVKNKRAGEVASFVALLTFAFASYPFNVLPFLIIFVFLLSSLAQKKSTGRKEYRY